MSSHFAEERLVFFPCGNVRLAGILALPAEPNGRTVLLPWGGGGFPSSARNRVRARLARELADSGFHAFRFDQPGVGESDGEYQVPNLSNPHIEEIVAASVWLRSQGLTRIEIIANCFGGWSSLMAAPLITGLEAMVVVNAPVRRDHVQVRSEDGSWRWWLKKIGRLKLRRLMKAHVRAKIRRQIATKASSLVPWSHTDTRFSHAVEYLLDHQIPVLLIYGNDDFRADLQPILDIGLRTALEKAGPPTRLVMVDERLEGFSNLYAQELLLKIVIPWLDDLPHPSR